MERAPEKNPPEFREYLFVFPLDSAIPAVLSAYIFYGILHSKMPVFALIAPVFTSGLLLIGAIVDVCGSGRVLRLFLSRIVTVVLVYLPIALHALSRR